MKKILVVLLVLAVATGVFAQEGEWSLKGGAEIGAYLDLKDDGGKAVIAGSGYNEPKGWYGPINGQLVVGYSRDAATVNLYFNNNDGDTIGSEFEYDGENFKFKAGADLSKLINGSLSEIGVKNIGALWGYYKFLNGLVHLEVAYNSRDTRSNNGIFWVSDKIGTFVNGSAILDYSGWWSDGPWSEGDTFTEVDHWNFLGTRVDLSNLSFGIVMPDVFGDSGIHENAGVPTTTIRNGQKAAHGKDGFYFVDDVLKQTIAGLKFTMQPIEVAAQFSMGNYGVYFGGKWFIGSVTAGLSFMGILDPDAPDKQLKFGGGVSYKPGPFGAWVNGWYAIKKPTNTTGTYSSQIGIEPGFFYNVIPTHLHFRTDIGFYFEGGKAGGSKKDMDVNWAVKPQLFWNFLGTGADDGYYGASGGWSGRATGIIVRYTLVSDVINALDVVFRWNF